MTANKAITVVLAIAINLGLLAVFGQLRYQPGPGDAGQSSQTRPVRVWIEQSTAITLAPTPPATASTLTLPPLRRKTGNTRSPPIGPIFYASSELQREPTPVSGPNIRRDLELDAAIALARLSLFIDRRGKVVRIEVLSSSGFSSNDIEKLRQMFLATRFFPGYRNEIPVASRINIAIHLTGQPVDTSRVPVRS